MLCDYQTDKTIISDITDDSFNSYLVIDNYSDYLKDLTIDNLKDRCKQKNISNYSKLKKNDLIELLINNLTSYIDYSKVKI